MSSRELLILSRGAGLNQADRFLRRHTDRSGSFAGTRTGPFAPAGITRTGPFALGRNQAHEDRSLRPGWNHADRPLRPDRNHADPSLRPGPESRARGPVPSPRPESRGPVPSPRSPPVPSPRSPRRLGRHSESGGPVPSPRPESRVDTPKLADPVPSPRIQQIRFLSPAWLRPESGRSGSFAGLVATQDPAAPSWMVTPDRADGTRTGSGGGWHASGRRIRRMSPSAGSFAGGHAGSGGWHADRIRWRMARGAVPSPA